MQSFTQSLRIRQVTTTLACVALLAAAVVASAIRASAQQQPTPVTVTIDAELSGAWITAGTYPPSSSVAIPATIGQPLRFRVDPTVGLRPNSWDDGDTCWVFAYWKWKPAGYSADWLNQFSSDQETDFVVPDTGVDQKSIEVTAVYWATSERWKYPACWTFS
jgi:hypothetical protein